MQKHFLYAVALALLAGCSKSKDSASPRADFSGKVQLVDEFGNNPTAGSSVQVAVTDVSPQVTTQTTADGTYSLSGLPSGTHTFTYTRSGYATCKYPSATLDPSQTVTIAPIVLSPVSSTVVTLNTVQQVGTDFVITGTVSPVPTASQPRPYRLYLQRYDNIQIKQPAEANYTLSLAGVARPDGTFIYTVKALDLQAANISYYSKLYVWASGDNPTASTYTSDTTGLLIYPAAVPVFANYKSFYFYP